MTDEEAVQNLANPDELLARVAFDTLVARSRKHLLHTLYKQGLEMSEAEEALQEALVKHWRGRLKFTPATTNLVARWLSYVRVIANRCHLDRVRQHQLVPYLPLDDERVPPEDLPLLESLLLGIRSGRIDLCADVLWLQADPALSPEVWERRLLAARLYYLDGADLQDIVEILALNPLDRELEAPINVSTIRGWLQTPSLFLKLAFHTLYLTNPQLESLLFRTLDQTLDTQPYRPHLLRELVKWHFGRGLSAYQIVSQNHISDPSIDNSIDNSTDNSTDKSIDNSIDKISVELLIEALCARLPFSQYMEDLLEGAMRAPRLEAHILLQESGLWRRLAFQYFYREDLSPACIVERTAPAARQVGLNINQGQVTTWTHGGRLLANLATCWKEHFLGDWDE